MLGTSDCEHAKTVRVWGEEGFFGDRRHCVNEARGIGEMVRFVLLSPIIPTQKKSPNNPIFASCVVGSI
ncbi:hypothetical protein MRB53_002329 [Persea americana]|uniref:Uncharacterized protein n=1 Tax=Persea americana TaxID=3435 RepID=A0ACC2MUF3_PERAE|nr:hypothetical protein MRB53_002329 [Persea americana]